jgi:hypothetical protein
LHLSNIQFVNQFTRGRWDAIKIFQINLVGTLGLLIQGKILHTNTSRFNLNTVALIKFCPNFRKCSLYSCIKGAIFCEMQLNSELKRLFQSTCECFDPTQDATNYEWIYCLLGLQVNHNFFQYNNPMANFNSQLSFNKKDIIFQFW